jgi:hypothetical protein
MHALVRDVENEPVVNVNQVSQVACLIFKWHDPLDITPPVTRTPPPLLFLRRPVQAAQQSIIIGNVSERGTISVVSGNMVIA